MSKVFFVVFRGAGLTHEQWFTEWNGEKHISLVSKIPGVKRWVLNNVTSMPHEAAPDGIAELWFDNAQALEHAMNSPAMAAAVEDGKRYLDMAKTYALVVNGHTIIG